MPQKQKISAEEKVKLVLECLDNKISVQEAARRVGVDFETVKTWISVYENEGAEGFMYGKPRQGIPPYQRRSPA